MFAADCSPGCQNGGSCVAPLECMCTKQYVGSLCEDFVGGKDALLVSAFIETISILQYILFVAITSDEKYCYVHDTCNGGHPDSLPALTGFGECCNNGGKSWGLSDGHEDSFCQACPVDGDFAGDPRDMLKPGGERSKQ